MTDLHDDLAHYGKIYNNYKCTKCKSLKILSITESVQNCACGGYWFEIPKGDKNEE